MYRLTTRTRAGTARAIAVLVLVVAGLAQHLHERGAEGAGDRLVELIGDDAANVVRLDDLGQIRQCSLLSQVMYS